MNRKEFFAKVGFGAAVALMPSCIGGLASSCSSDNSSSPSPGTAPAAVDFILDVSTGSLATNGGFLVTSSCTNLVSPELFLETIQMAAWDAKKRIRQVTYQSQSSDHPIIWGMENTHYLKFLIVEVCDR